MPSPVAARGLTLRLVESGLCFSVADLPNDVVAVARHCLFDWLSVLHADRDHPGVESLGLWRWKAEP